MKVLAGILISFILILSGTQAFAAADSDFVFYGKGKVDPNSPFAGETVRTIISGDKGLIMHTGYDGIVIVRLSVSESQACIYKASTACFDAVVTGVKNTKTHEIGDKIELTVDLLEKKELVSVISGPLQGSNITINLEKTKTLDGKDFVLNLSTSGGIAGIQKMLTIDSSKKIILVKQNSEESTTTVDNDTISQLRDLIEKSRLIDATVKDYPPTQGSADYFAYSMEISIGRFTNNVQWTDTSDNVPKKLRILLEKINSITTNKPGEGNLVTRQVEMARQFVLSSQTFAFDGIEETLQIGQVFVLKTKPPQYEIPISFDSRHGGYGNRTGQIVTEAITPHVMTVRVSEDKVIYAVTDQKWDELIQEMLEDERNAIDYQGLIDNLNSLGATVEMTGNTTELLSVQGKIIKVNGSEVQVFEFDNIEHAKEKATLVSPDGGMLDNTPVRWMAPPHFFQKGTIIVLYVGNDPAIVELLDKIVGPQFAGS